VAWAKLNERSDFTEARLALTGISFSISDEQRDLAALAHEFAERELRPIARAVDEADVEPQIELVHKAAEVGLTAYMLPEAYGGGGIESLVTDCLIVEELSWGDGGLGALVTSGGFFADPILELGSEEQKARLLGPLCGERPPLTALATTEPDHGSDAAGMTTLATRVDGGFRLRGQ
jgi:alkylation response protein AidB-like acyl-CoA dehydrogenase